jgi:hypothetical protein
MDSIVVFVLWRTTAVAVVHPWLPAPVRSPPAWGTSGISLVLGERTLLLLLLLVVFFVWNFHQHLSHWILKPQSSKISQFFGFQNKTKNGTYLHDLLPG